jgi:hypothetical protein
VDMLIIVVSLVVLLYKLLVSIFLSEDRDWFYLLGQTEKVLTLKDVTCYNQAQQ